MKEDFIGKWALKAWELENHFRGTMSGGIDPPKQMISYDVKGDTAIIKYDYPETCGLSDVRYHVTDPHKIRTDIFVFTNDGSILMNDEEFPGSWGDETWTEDDAKKFIKEYTSAFKKEMGIFTLRDKLMAHRGHNIACVSYGDWNDPADVCIECEDCCEVLVSTETEESYEAVNRDNLPEFIGQIIDTFEDFLEEKGITLDNPEIKEAIEDGQDPEGLAIIYGSDYGQLQTDLESLLVNWGLTKEV